MQSLDIDGTPTTKSWLQFADIADGATLDYTMAATANTAWGSGEADLPPSFAPP